MTPDEEMLTAGFWAAFPFELSSLDALCVGNTKRERKLSLPFLPGVVSPPDSNREPADKEVASSAFSARLAQTPM
jgi:hypothetical protein